MGSAVASSHEQIATVRGFNRFYTRQIGLLDERLLHSRFSLTEARVLYELACTDSQTATDLARELGLDPGYLSRILKKFEKAGLLARSLSDHDARQSVLSLTAAGHDAFAPLDQASREEIAGMLDKLSSADRTKLVRAMTTIQSVLGDVPNRQAPYALRLPRPGDIGWIIHRQGVLYAQDYDWDETFEALVAEIAAGFIKSFDPERERCWVAERHGDVVGSVFVMCEAERTAKLRLLYVEPAARGLGIGSRLVDECISFARDKGYRTLVLWTNDVLVSARRIYEAAGFKLIEEEKHHSFGKDLVGQHWCLQL